MKTNLCSECGKEKDERAFSFKIKKIGKRQSMCKKCHNEYSKKHYTQNKERYVLRASMNMKASRRRAGEYVFNYLLNHPCTDCNNNDVIILEFDHVRGKKIGDVGRMVTQGYSVNTIKKEVEKCEVRCPNCHKKRHAVENDFWILKALRGEYCE